MTVYADLSRYIALVRMPRLRVWITTGWKNPVRDPVVLAQTGSPSVAIGPETVGICETAMAPRTGDGVNTVFSVAGTAEVYLSNKRYSSAAVAVVTAAVNIRIIQVGVVETGIPRNALSRRLVFLVIPEAGVALGAPPQFVPIVGVELVGSGVAGPEGYRQGGQRPDHGSTAK
jgi:hypothetical protein